MTINCEFSLHGLCKMHLEDHNFIHGMWDREGKLYGHPHTSPTHISVAQVAKCFNRDVSNHQDSMQGSKKYNFSV